jgi:hypothetical protein
MDVCAQVCDVGALVSWSGAEDDGVGVVTELLQGGRQGVGLKDVSGVFEGRPQEGRLGLPHKSVLEALT